MARRNRGGFVPSESYWDIGTDAARGRDGDTARDASKKFNDHRHPAEIAVSPQDLVNWTNELEDISEHSSGVAGGFIAPSANVIRDSGDSADYAGNLYAKTSAGVYCTTSGFGPRIDATTFSLVSDQIAGNYKVTGAVEIPVGERVVFTSEGSTTVFPCAVAHRAAVTTRVVIASALVVTSPFPANLVANAGGVKPVITADVRVSYYPYDAVEGTIPLTLGSSSIPVRVEATRYGAAQATANNLANTVTGYAVQTIDEVSGNFFGKISVEVQCDVDTFYT
jgi:hypothetical protein